jgi:hypothetical protein
MPSATRARPISSTKDSASIFTLGCAWMNRTIGPEATSMITTAMTMAAAMTQICCAMPTAVMTESNEKTMSSITICAMALEKLPVRR